MLGRGSVARAVAPVGRASMAVSVARVVSVPTIVTSSRARVVAPAVSAVARVATSVAPTLSARAMSAAASKAPTSRATKKDSVNKLYELRIYDIQPQHFPGFMALCGEHMGTRFKHSPCLGYWMSEVGGVNATVHLWEYDSYQQRAGVRVALAGDAGWMNGFMAKMRPMLDKQFNASARAVIPVREPIVEASNAGKGFYEIVFYDSDDHASHKSWNVQAMTAEADAVDTGKSTGPIPLGVFDGEIGRPSESFVLWYWPSLADRDDQAVRRYSGYSNGRHAVESRLLQPAAFSPWK